MLLPLSYILLSLLMATILYLIGNYAIVQSTQNLKDRSSKRLRLLGGLVFWQVYIGVLGSSGILKDFSFPPRFVIFLIAPAFIFIGVFLSSNRNRNWIQAIPPLWLVVYQSFRIAIETLFVFTVAVGFLHQNVSIEGYNYDMVFAFSTLPVAALVYFSPQLPRSLLLFWNYLGLAVIASIIFLFNTTIYYPELYGPHTEAFPVEFGGYPYVLVPGFLMPSAVFVHVLSIVQLNQVNMKYSSKILSTDIPG